MGNSIILGRVEKSNKALKSLITFIVKGRLRDLMRDKYRRVHPRLIEGQKENKKGR